MAAHKLQESRRTRLAKRPLAAVRTPRTAAAPTAPTARTATTATTAAARTVRTTPPAMRLVMRPAARPRSGAQPRMATEGGGDGDGDGGGGGGGGGGGKDEDQASLELTPTLTLSPTVDMQRSKLVVCCEKCVNPEPNPTQGEP